MSGSGSAANPFVVTGLTNCAQVRNCFVDGTGISYNPGLGRFDVCISPLPGNTLVTDLNSCLFVPSNTATVSVGCGIEGTGAPADPVQANVNSWTFPCDQNSNASRIYCNPLNGRLQGEPDYHTYGETFGDAQLFPNTPAPAGTDVVIATFSNNFINPDPCRSMNLFVEEEQDVTVMLPPGGTVTVGMNLDDMWRKQNGGVNTIQESLQTTKAFFRASNIAPGAGVNVVLTTSMSGGSGGATYSRVQAILRALWLPSS